MRIYSRPPVPSSGSGILALGLLVSGLFMQSGCEDPQGIDQLESTDQELATGFKGTDGRFLTPWTSPGSINVCFLTKKTAGGGAGTPNATLVANITAAMRRSWQASTGITFSFRGTCPATIASSWMSIFVDNDGSYYAPVAAMAGMGQRFSSSYMGATEWAKLGPQIDNRTDVQVYLPDNGQDWNLKTAHEVGHALGYYHEMERRDNSSSCLANPSGNTYGWLTPYDANSIMLWSYCPSSLTGDNPLTPYDALGGEMLYPRQYSGEKLSCSSNCFETGAGVVAYSTGAFTIDWVRRGANVAFIGAPVYNYSGANHTPSNGIVSVSSFAAGSTSVTMTFNDGYKRQHTGSGIVTKSDDTYAALMFAAL